MHVIAWPIVMMEVCCCCVVNYVVIDVVVDDICDCCDGMTHGEVVVIFGG